MTRQLHGPTKIYRNLRGKSCKFIVTMIGMSAAALSHGEVIFQENFSNSLGEFTASGRVSPSNSGATLRGGAGTSTLTSVTINTHNYRNLSVRFDRTTSRLDTGEPGLAQVSVNAGSFYTLESTINADGTASYPLPPHASDAQNVVLRFQLSASSYYESYHVDNVILEGDADPAPTPPQPTPPSAGDSHFWELSGDLGTHDPTIAEENGVWYEFQTGPGIYRKVSYDGGLHWQPLPSVFSQKLNWWSYYVPNQSGADVWAPEVRQFGERVWMYYAISTFGSTTSAIGLASASSLAADDWQDEGLVIRTRSDSDYNAIDPDLVIDASANPWLAFGSWSSGIKLTRLDAGTMKPTGSLYSIAAREGGIEAPTIVYRNGYYHLFVSVGKCCAGTDSTYEIRYGRATNITGPYLDQNGIDMMQGGGSLLDAGNNRWVGPGGQDIAGSDVIARHAYDADDNGAAKLLINTLNWTDDDWPTY